MLEQSPHTGIDELLHESRRKLQRLAPRDASNAVADGAFLIDIRSENQRAADGTVPGSTFVPRNVMCDQGYQSNLATAVLQTLGLSRATDVVGGFQAGSAAGLPVDVR